MGFKFSKNKIEAFVGEVFAVYLVSDDGSVPCGVKWSASQNGLNVRVFDKDERYGTEPFIKEAGLYCVDEHGAPVDAYNHVLDRTRYGYNHFAKAYGLWS